MKLGIIKGSSTKHVEEVKLNSSVISKNLTFYLSQQVLRVMMSEEKPHSEVLFLALGLQQIIITFF